MLLKEGDVVMVRHDLSDTGFYHEIIRFDKNNCPVYSNFSDCAVEEMVELAGQFVTISNVYESYYAIEDDGHACSWTDEMFLDSGQIVFYIDENDGQPLNVLEFLNEVMTA